MPAEEQPDPVSLGTNDAQTGYPLPTLAQNGILLKVGIGCSSASLVLIHSSHRQHVLVAPMHVYIGVSRGPQAL